MGCTCKIHCQESQLQVFAVKLQHVQNILNSNSSVFWVLCQFKNLTAGFCRIVVNQRNHLLGPARFCEDHCFFGTAGKLRFPLRATMGKGKSSKILPNHPFTGPSWGFDIWLLPIAQWTGSQGLLASWVHEFSGNVSMICWGYYYTMNYQWSVYWKLSHNNDQQGYLSYDYYRTMDHLATGILQENHT